MTTCPNDRLGATELPAVAVGGPFAGHSGAPADDPRTLWQVLEATTAAFPKAIAIDDGRSVVSYRDLLGRARRAGERLAALGLGAGDRIGIRITPGSAELYLFILAVLSIGAAYVPVDMDDLDDGAELVWSATGVRAVLSDHGKLTWRSLPDARTAARPPGPEDDAWITLTSGTTSTPTGVAVTHGDAAAFVDAAANRFPPDDPPGPADEMPAGRPVAFDTSYKEMWLAWRHGACLVLAPPLGRPDDAERIAD
jgi:non-ribosomal peptide synthetase component F